MSENPPAPGKTQLSNTVKVAGSWTSDIALAAAVGATFFLVAKIVSWGTTFQPRNVSLFWPPTGVSCGLLIVLGSRRQWPSIAGIAVASAVINYYSWHNLWLVPAIAACNVMEALIVAGLFTRYFGDTDFPLDRARNIFGLLGAAAIAAVASSLIATAALRLSLGPSIGVVATLQQWFASVFVGIVTVTPFVIGFADAVHHPPSRRECIEGTFALLSLALVTAVIVALPQESWEALLPVAWPFPILLWLAAHSRPVFAAAGAFLVSNIIVWTTTFGVGHFGDAGSSLINRVLEAQTAILFLATSAYLLAALFAERRKSEALLTRSNAMLERERNNKLMNAEATSAAIAHELKQPLAAIVANADASLEFLAQAPPNLVRAKEALNDIVADGHRTSEALDGVRTLFRTANDSREPVDMSEICHDVLHSMRSELNGHSIVLQSELTSEVLLVRGNRGQLQQVMFNLAHNAVEAMVTAKDRSRVLRLITKRDDRGRIVVAVQDTGPGVDPKRLEEIFDAFVTTKPQGTGLGLAICRIIIERHGGELVAFSDGRNGALFQFSLPIEVSDELATRV